MDFRQFMTPLKASVLRWFLPHRVSRSGRHFLVVALYALLCTPAQAQLDSLIHESKQNHPDTVLLSLWNQIAFQYRTKNTDSTLFYARKALALAETITNDRWIGRSYYSIGVGFHIKGTFDSAVHHYKKGIPFAQSSGDQKGLARHYNNLGLVDWNQGELRTGLNYFLESYKIDKALGDSSGMITSINNIGLIHKALNEHQEALEYFQRSLVILEKIGGNFRLSQLHNNLGMTYTILEKLDTSMFHYQQALKYASLSNAECYQAHPLLGIADVLLRTEGSSIDTLIYYGSLALRTAEKCGLPKITSSTLIFLGDAHKRSEDYQKAESYYVDGLELATKYKINQSVMDASQRLYLLYKSQEKWQEAFANHEIYELSKSKLQGEEKIREVARLEAEFKADQERKLLLAQQENERLIYEKQRNFYSIVAVISLMLVLLLGFIYCREKLNSNTLTRKNKLISELSTFKNELTQMIAHDIKNPLNSIIALSSTVEQKTGKDITKAGEAILRLITNMLDVEKFEDTQPDLRLESIHLSKLISEAKLAVELLLYDKSIQLQVELERDVKVTIDKQMMTRVLINLLSNAIKYSPSNSEIRIEAHVTSAHHRKYVRIGIIDEGTGIPEEDQPYLFEKFYQADARKSGLAPSTGLGLTYCKMAINAHDGSISVESKINEGTTFWITLQVDEVLGESVRMQEDSQTIEISESELAVLKGYSSKLKALKVYNVSAIMPILDEIDDLFLETKWSAQVRSAVRYSNEKQFVHLLNMI